MFTLQNAAPDVLERLVLKTADACLSPVLTFVTPMELGLWLARHGPAVAAPLLQIAPRQMGRQNVGVWRPRSPGTFRWNSCPVTSAPDPVMSRRDPDMLCLLSSDPQHGRGGRRRRAMPAGEAWH